MSGEPHRSPADIEQAVRGTRIALGHTIDALERKLRARHLMQEGLAMVTESFAEPAGAGAGARLAAALRANPLAVALIGAGLAWLVAGNTRLLDRVADDERVRGAVRQIADLAGTIGGGAAAGSAAAADMAGTWVHRAAGVVRDTGSNVIGRAGVYSEYAGERAGRVAGDLWERNALLVGAVGVVAGALLAAALPSTRLETD